MVGYSTEDREYSLCLLSFIMYCFNLIIQFYYHCDSILIKTIPLQISNDDSDPYGQKKQYIESAFDLKHAHDMNPLS